MNVRTINEDLELQNKKRKKKQRNMRRFVFWVKFILTTALIVATTVLLALSPLFQVGRIEVRGAAHYSPESLVSLSGVIRGENGFKQVGSSPGNILGLRIGSAEKLIKQNCPYVKDVRVRYVLPGLVLIQVDERTPAAVVSGSGTSVLVDGEGFALEVPAPEDAGKLPVVTGVKFSNCVPGKKPDYENAEGLRAAFRLLGEIKAMDKDGEDKLLPRVDSVDAADPKAMVLSLESRLRIKLGDLQDLNYRLSVTKTILARNIKKEEKGILDFTSGEDPVFTPESGG